MSDDFFALPAFRAAESMVQLKRQLRELRPLAERGDGFEIGGRSVVTLAVSATGDTIEAKIARRASMRPEWDKSVIRNSADQRKFLDTVKARLSRWTEDD